ncbi:MAG: hypothetical protein WD355_06505 [Balneolaceae bacterium]
MLISARDLGAERAIQASALLKLPVSWRKRWITPKRGRMVIRVPTESIQSFVSNRSLEYLFEPERVRKPNIPSFFWPGEWDRERRPIEPDYREESVAYRSVRQIFVEGLDYRESDEYQSKVSELRSGNGSVRGGTVEELNEYFESLLKLAETIRADGYKSQKELGGKLHDEIGIFIGRDGALIKAEDNFSGTHRFAIARILNIATVPVTILAVHDQWADENPNLLCNPAALEKGIL